MGLLRVLATAVVGFFVAWLVVAVQYLVTSGTYGVVVGVGVLVGFAVIALVGLRLVV